MAKLPVSDAGEALKRVTGISIVGGRYVFVRGLGERYSNTLLNSVQIPSPEPNRRVVPMDIFPANLLESLQTVKTFSSRSAGQLCWRICAGLHERFSRCIHHVAIHV